MSTVNQIPASEVMYRTNRRTFLSYLGGAPTLTAVTGAGVLSSHVALADTGPLDASERRHQAFVIRRGAGMMRSVALPVLLAFLSVPCCLNGQTVKITPLGAKTGELCVGDRGLVLEDPTGVRILYDPGPNVAGPTDGRLGTIDAALLTHVHTDHIGDSKLDQDPDSPAAKCDTIARAPARPTTNLAEIVAAKNAAFIAALPVTDFVGAKLQGILGAPVAACVAGGRPIVTPLNAPCLGGLLFGGKRTVQRAGSNGTVQIWLVTALHDNTVGPTLLDDPLTSLLASQGLHLQAGQAAGFVVMFSNGLTAYLSGDTGPTADMRTIVSEHYHANLAVVNIGFYPTMRPEEAAYAMNTLVRPKSVIVSHVDEVATTGGKVNPGTRTETFLSQIEMAGFVPLSGRTMEFNGDGDCVAGCSQP